ncbi:MAG: SUMF1/EgtB/PvdO family nonheme iron enzyme [Gammaproteobacteria bacterium]|nr:SUMF1/EgtB/PvdO family nonheme iron enzyme [Gammaproteobacteria bacterium]
MKMPDNPHEKQQLIKLLLKCPSFQSAEAREALLSLLPPAITDMIKGSGTGKVYAVNIVNTCLNYPGGFDLLLEQLRFFDGETIPFRALTAFLETWKTESNTGGEPFAPESAPSYDAADPGTQRIHAPEQEARQGKAKKILIFSANPKTVPYLRLDEEVREILEGLKRVRLRAEFELIPAWAVRPHDLRRALLDHEPQIVQFSGHGKGTQGICLENDAGEALLVSNVALARLFKLFNGKIECVLFNACYSEAQAEVIQHYTDYVIGMNDAVGDAAALKFVMGFYDALGAGRDYADAYEFGCAAIDMEGIDEAPVLKKRRAGTSAAESSTESLPELEKSDPGTRLAEELLDTFKNLLNSAGAAAQVKPRDEFSYYNGAAMQRIRKAVELLKKLPAGKPEHNHLNILAGSTLSSAGGLHEAEKLFEQAKECTANDYEYALASFNLFQVRLRRKAYAEALADLLAAIERDPRRYALHDTEKYPIERILGVGGMGCAFLCRHRLQKKPVAVKCLWESRPGKPEEVFREAFLMREIAGEYVPAPLDYGYADPIKQQRAFFVSEYIENAADGDAWLEQHGKLALAPGLRLALQIAKGLRAAHQAGICHYDLKPANLLLLAPSPSPQGDKIRDAISSRDGISHHYLGLGVKIIDFGLAGIARSLTEEVRKQRGGLSLLGQAVFGTLDYAPPEQQGMTEFGAPGSKSDIFSFGATLYRLFSGDSPRFPHPRKLPDSPELQELLLDCMEQEPQQRPDIEEVIVRLERALAETETECLKRQQEEQKAEAGRKARKEKEAREKAEAERLKRQQEEQKSEAEYKAKEEKGKPQKPEALRPRNFAWLWLALLILAGIAVWSFLPPDTPPATVELAVEADADGAKVFINGEERGIAPVKTDLSLGNYTIRVEKPGYVPFEEQIELTEAMTLKAKLEPETAVLTVHAKPGGKVFINNENRGMTPLELSLSLGGYTVRVEKAGYAPFEKRIDLKGAMTLQAELMAATKPLRPGKTFRDKLKDGGEGPEMVVIPAGSFRMGDIQGGGDSDEQFVHKVRVEQFAIGKYEVTASEFRQFVQAAGYKTEAEQGKGCYVDRNKDGYGENVDDANWRNPYFSQGDGHPAVCVSGNDAAAYVKWLSGQTGEQYRLPTEAEWEYAARAGTETSRYWGNEKNRACEYANVSDKMVKAKLPAWRWTTHDCSDGYVYTASASRFKPNGFSLYDMLGNAWEWTCSEYTDKYNGEEKVCYSKNRAGVRQVLRGGSWQDSPKFVRTANRSRYSPGTRKNIIGFRVVRRAR